MMQTYNKVNAEQFADEIYTICHNFKGSSLTAESMYYLQLELDNLLLELITCIVEVVAIVIIRLAFRELRKANESHAKTNAELAEINAKIRARSNV